jgi:hypothetical protein
MHERLKAAQDSYVAELRSVVPAVSGWWAEQGRLDARKSVGATELGFDFRWPAGAAGHPRILAIFRKHFFEVERINYELEMSTGPGPMPKSEDLWGKDIEEPTSEMVLPIDLLVEDLSIVAPDLYEIMGGLVFIPIGVDPKGDTC